MIAKVLRWLFFTVFLSLIPIGVSYLVGAANTVSPLTLNATLEHGDLYLLCCAFCATGLGELIGLGKRRFEGVQIFVAGVAITHLVTCLILYVVIKNPPANTDIQYFVNLSKILFASGVLTSTACVAITEVQDAG
ncbi:hypothetical protein [Mesorhizobium sp.]|uniref:hypothetical protein n=1 Tax=Mesorhizobium sp. TaxID=1871066 RepID=UPI000FE9B548|nr:hypothetical protein [Mesorhizobium sp.]RWO87961.1 MAG: hypothetical protein EOQ96_10470 [Mesorhizobium sp.]